MIASNLECGQEKMLWLHSSFSIREGKAVHTPIKTSLRVCTNITELNFFWLENLFDIKSKYLGQSLLSTCVDKHTHVYINIISYGICLV